MRQEGPTRQSEIPLEGNFLVCHSCLLELSSVIDSLILIVIEEHLALVMCNLVCKFHVILEK